MKARDVVRAMWEQIAQRERAATHDGDDGHGDGDGERGCETDRGGVIALTLLESLRKVDVNIESVKIDLFEPTGMLFREFMCTCLCFLFSWFLFVCLEEKGRVRVRKFVCSIELISMRFELEPSKKFSHT